MLREPSSVFIADMHGLKEKPQNLSFPDGFL